MLRLCVALVGALLLTACATRQDNQSSGVDVVTKRVAVKKTPAKAADNAATHWRWGSRGYSGGWRWSGPRKGSRGGGSSGDMVSRRVKAIDIGPGTSIKAIQPVYFATNRKILKHDELELSAITAERGALEYGKTLISIPQAHKFGKVSTPETYFFGLLTEKEDDSLHYTVKKLEGYSQSGLAEELKRTPIGTADTVLLFIHGYNVPFSHSLFRAAQIAYDANYAGHVLVFSWPSMGKTLAYDYDRESANYSDGHLLSVLKMLSDDIGNKKIFVVAHSLGNHILINALHQAAISGTKLNISELVMAAPDVDKDVFTSKAAQIKSVAGNVTMYVSSADKALLVSDKKSWGQRMGYISKGGPNLVDGIETIDVTAVGSDMFALNHSEFSGNRLVLDDLGRIIMYGQHPPSARSGIFQGMPNKANPKYWMYPF